MDPLSTHSYDGRLDRVVLEKLNQLGIQRYSLEEKKNKAYELLNDSKKFNGRAVQILVMIISRMGNPDNYEPISNIWTDDLIYVCYLLRSNNDFMQLLECQLIEMEHGFCVQGRVNRLFQIISPFIDLLVSQSNHSDSIPDDPITVDPIPPDTITSLSITVDPITT